MNSIFRINKKDAKGTATTFSVAVLFAFLSVALSFGAVAVNAEETSDDQEISQELAEVLEEVTDATDIVNLINDTWEGGYEYDPTGYEVYQLKRLIVLADDDEILTDSYGAVSVLYYEEYNEYVLQFETEKDTATAYTSLVNDLGADDVFIDEVVTAEILEGDVEGITSYDALTWGAATMGMDYLKGEYDYYAINTEVTVAIIDSGVDTTSSIFDGRIDERHSYYFVGDDDETSVTLTSSWADELWHGTHVAGIIAECTPENVSLMVLRCFDSNGDSSNLAIRTAFQYALDNGADVLNMSLGWTSSTWATSTFLADVLSTAESAGMIVCVAAGNKSADVTNTYPANRTNVITVTGVGKNLKFGSTYSNYGSTVDFCAPGTAIVSTILDGATATSTGTSMACPHMAAAVAYIKMINKSATLSTVMSILKDYAVDLGDSGWDQYYGYGYVNLHSYFDDQNLVTQDSDYDADGNLKTPATISFASSAVTKTYGADAFTVSVTTNSTGKVTYESSNTSVATVDREGYIILKSAGTCTITANVKADSTYSSNSASLTLTVNALDISSVTATLSQTTYTYDGKAKKPTVTFSNSNITTSDYKISYSDNTAAGVATVTITGKNGCTGTITKTFIINFADAVTISSVANGSSGVDVKWTKLTSAKGYYIYRKQGSGSWKKVGTVTSGSTVTFTDTTAVTGKTYKYRVRAYSGTVTSDYSKSLSIKAFIAPTVKVKYNGSTIKVKWSKVTGATSYELYRKVGSGKLKLVTTTTRRSYTETKFTKNKKYTYVVKAVSKTQTSAKSEKAICFTLKKVTVKKTSLSSGKLTAKWSKNSVASGYQIQYSVNKNMKGKKTVTVGKKYKSTTISGLSADTYYIRIRAYKTSGGKKYYSAWSSVIKVEAK